MREIDNMGKIKNKERGRYIIEKKIEHNEDKSAKGEHERV